MQAPAGFRLRFLGQPPSSTAKRPLVPRPHHPQIEAEMEEDTPWNGIENGIDDPEELSVIYRTLDSYQ
jgi:hypothetical protein